jgi:hypothetical protein
MTKFRLSDLDLDFISLVAAGDDPTARVVLAKAEPVEKGKPNKRTSPKEIVGSHGHKSHGPSILWPALYEHLRAKGYSKEKAARISNAAWHKKKAGIPLNTPTSVRGIAKAEWDPKDYDPPVTWGVLKAVLEVADQDDEFISKAEMHKSGTSLTPVSTVSNQNPTGEDAVADKNDQISKDDLPAEVVEYIEALEAEVEELAEAVENAPKAPEGTEVQKNEGDPVAVALAKADPALRAFIEKQQADLADATKIAKAEREARLTREYQEVAKSVPFVADNPTDLASFLRELADLDAEAATKVVGLLRDANTAVEKSAAFVEIGKTGPQVTLSANLEGKVAELRKSDSALTQEAAIAKALAENPSLYDEMIG